MTDNTHSHFKHNGHNGIHKIGLNGLALQPVAHEDDIAEELIHLTRQDEKSDNDKIEKSKINRMVQYYSKRPQVQERLTEQITNSLVEILKTDDVAVVIEADHLCVASRGINDVNSSTFTASYRGKFNKGKIRSEFLSHVNFKQLR